MTVKVYLDLDDTLANTSKFIERVYSYNNYNINDSLFKKNINLYKDYKIWQSIKKDSSFWLKLEKREHAEKIYKEALKLSGDTNNIYILTALPRLFFKKDSVKFERAKCNKIKWVNLNFKDIPTDNILVVHARDKKNYVLKENKNTQYILFDDRIKNVEEWKKAGGSAYLVNNNGFVLF